MDVGVVGCGYVGLAAAIGLARAGHRVVAVEIDGARREQLSAGVVPFSEPELGARLHTVRFVGDLSGLRAEVVLVAVPTDPDHREVVAVLRQLGACGARVVVVKSTVAPSHVPELVAAAAPVPVVLNPEFLREGHALADFVNPDRLVLGGDPEAVEAALAVYRPLYGDRVPVIRTDAQSAALGKLAANAMLAVRVSFGNELLRAAVALGADPDDVRTIVGTDPRIGPSHLRPSTGAGGPCLPKDGRILLAEARAHGLLLSVIEGGIAGTELHRDWILAHLERRLGGLSGRRVAVLGLAFKPGVGDVRGSTALALVGALIERGATVAVHDPEARVPDAAPDPGSACRDADVIVVATPWPALLDLDPRTLAPRHRRLFDPSRTLGPRWAAAGYEVWP